MDIHGLTLVIPSKADPERDSVAGAWEQRGGTVLRLDRFWSPPEIDRQLVRLYGNDTFCLVLAQKLGLELVSPRDDLLVGLEQRWVKREIACISLDTALAEPFPRFIKPLVPKVFRAKVYRTPDELRTECRGLEAATPVLSSEPVSITAEARSFVCDGRVVTCALYEGNGEVSDASGFLQDAARALTLPRTCVLDAALIEGRGWGLVEANATWGAGLNGCSANDAIECIALASRPGSLVDEIA